MAAAAELRTGRTSMHSSMIAFLIALAFACALLRPAHAAPGEDPVTIHNRVTYLQLPTAVQARSGSIQYRKDMPDNVSAKATRYTAKAFSGNVGTIATERDVVQSVQTNGLQTKCTQSVGSVSAEGGSISMTNNEQIVVLRGDLINICN